MFLLQPQRCSASPVKAAFRLRRLWIVFSAQRPSPFFRVCVNNMDREIRARIGTARLLLDRLAGDPTVLASASRTQCTALVDAVLRAKTMEKADKATLAELAQHVQWEALDAATVARAFAGRWT